MSLVWVGRIPRGRPRRTSARLQARLARQQKVQHCETVPEALRYSRPPVAIRSWDLGTGRGPVQRRASPCGRRACPRHAARCNGSWCRYSACFFPPSVVSCPPSHVRHMCVSGSDGQRAAGGWAGLMGAHLWRAAAWLHVFPAAKLLISVECPPNGRCFVGPELSPTRDAMRCDGDCKSCEDARHGQEPAEVQQLRAEDPRGLDVHGLDKRRGFQTAQTVRLGLFFLPSQPRVCLHSCLHATGTTAQSSDWSAFPLVPAGRRILRARNTGPGRFPCVQRRWLAAA